ncbi:MAG: DNA mismatch repair endonuclease MutL [Elusimicrobia bacterium]|nr:DNA mismatch repair endonuclease MutL [Elusimicrobiota bacterium]
MGAVRVLEAGVASRIAAGEVVERPASVLKELIENALDAGATRIAVESEGAGRKLLRVSDDGCGMDAADCRAAFERHATSKIRALEDLECLASFGFRGEALYAVAAVSKVILTSALQAAKAGRAVSMAGGKLAKDAAAAPVKGTVIEVRELFYNTPARLKFLKSDASERGALARVVEEAALANPGVRFTLKSEGRESLRFEPAAGPDALKRRAAEVLGTDKAAALIWAEAKTPSLTVRALVSPPDALVGSRALQFVLVNRRPVASRSVQQALYRAYEPFRHGTRHPAAVVLLEAPPELLDVNVHPTKREVRFREESLVFDTVTRAVSKALLAAKGIPTLTFGKAPQPSPAPAYAYPAPTESRTAEAPRTRELPISRPEPRPQRPWFDEGARYLGQIERAYLLFEASGGLLMVDQHAAQERVLFEKYMAEIESGSVAVQRLMLPLPVVLPASAVAAALARKERLARAGFEVAVFGKTTLRVSTVPAVFAKAGQVEDAVHRALDGLTAPGAAAADARYDATATIACKAAVKAHDPLSEREALALLESLRACKDATACPHGRPSMVALDREELARRFRRPGAVPL